MKTTNNKQTSKNTAFKVVNEQVLAGLKAQGLKWFKPWRLPNGDIYTPCNWVTGRAYNGINRLLLSSVAQLKGYTSGEWATFDNISQNGGRIIKGQKGTGIVYWVQSFKNKETGEFYPTEKALIKAGFTKNDKVIEEIWSLKYFTVFNIEQAEGIESKIPVNNEPVEASPIPQAESIYNNYKNAPKLLHGGDSAHYSPLFDKVQMPEAKYFVDVESYYKTLFHELIHSTGHQDRLAREGVVNHDGFGSELYSKEELVAEIGAWYLTGLCNLEPKDSAFNSQAYINGWVKHLEDKEREVVYAMTQAQKAVDYILEGKGVKTPSPSEKVNEEPVLASNQISIVSDSEGRFINHSELKTDRIEGQIGANENALIKHLKSEYKTDAFIPVFNTEKGVEKYSHFLTEVIKVDGVNYNIYNYGDGVGYAALNRFKFELIAKDLRGQTKIFKFILESPIEPEVYPIEKAYRHAIQVCQKYFWEFVEVKPYAPSLNSNQASVKSQALNKYDHAILQQAKKDIKAVDHCLSHFNLSESAKTELKNIRSEAVNDFLHTFNAESTLPILKVETENGDGQNEGSLIKYLNNIYQVNAIKLLDFTLSDAQSYGRAIAVVEVDECEYYYIYNTTFGGEPAIGYVNIHRNEFKLSSKQVTIKYVKEICDSHGYKYFDAGTMRFFNQKLSDFKIYPIGGNKYYLEAPSYWDGELMGYSCQIYNDAEGTLEDTRLDDDEKLLPIQQKLEAVKEKQEARLNSRQVTIYEQGVCPKCGSEELEYESIQIDKCSGQHIYYPFECRECGTVGDEFYKLTYEDTIANVYDDGETKEQNEKLKDVSVS